MRPQRVFSLILLVAAELAVLVAIVAVLRTTTGVNGWNWRWSLGSLGGPVETKSEEFLPVQPGQKVLVVRNDIGRVTVRNVTAGFGVRAVVHAFGQDLTEAKENLQQVQVSVTPSDTEVRVEARGPHQWLGRTPYADLEVLVPAGTTVRVDASMGAVDVYDFAGSIDVLASMGRVKMERVNGNIIVDAKMGRVEVDQAVVQEKLDLQAKMGSVEFSGRLGHNNNVEANMGSIKIALENGHPAVNLDAEWNMGSFKYRQPIVGSVTKKSAQGTLGQGQPVGSLRIRSDMGSIEIK